MTTPRRALITRPAEDATALAVALEAQGWAVHIEPLLTIVPLPDVPLPLDGVQAILATSANGVRALAPYAASHRIPLWAVGDATARCARALGFTVAASADGDVESLIARVAAEVDPARGALLHAAGSHRAGRLTEDLTARGFETRRIILYRAEEATEIPPVLRTALDSDRIDDALFFSPRTATAFVRLLVAAELAPQCRRLSAYALSPAVATVLTALPWLHLRVAARPDQPSLLASLMDRHDV